MKRHEQPRYGLARVLSKRGALSRRRAAECIRAGRVRVEGRVVRDPEAPTALDATITLDGERVEPVERIVLALNKRRGWVCTASDEKGRATIYEALAQAPDLPWLFPVGRLDRASEGLILLSNDTALSARILDPERGPPKTYHLKLRGPLRPLCCFGVGKKASRMGASFSVLSNSPCCGGGRRSFWLAVRLKGGRNRQLRRMAAASGHEVERLIRVAIGGLSLGPLGKGAWRRLREEEELALLFAKPPPLIPPSA